MSRAREGGPWFRLPPYRVEARITALAETIDWGLRLFGVPELWRTTRGTKVRVAVLDTGIDESHPDLADALEATSDFTRSRVGPRDVAGHGTHVAGIVAARQNGVGVLGVAPECRLLIGKVLGDDGSGSETDVAAGIDWALERGAQVVSLSLGSPRESAAIRAAILRAVGAGAYIVCAAGNDGRAHSVNFPARLDEVIAVGAVDRERQLARFSSRGEEVDVCAPGEAILSTYPGGGYASLSGTSMATPFVSGVLALWTGAGAAKETGRSASPREVVELLRRTADDAGPSGPDAGYGFGLINPARLLAARGAGEVEGKFEIGPLEVNGVRGVFVFEPRGAAGPRGGDAS